VEKIKDCRAEYIFHVEYAMFERQALEIIKQRCNPKAFCNEDTASGF
jgi:hypothetical protein